MRIKSLATSVAALAMVVAPVAASANPAAPLSVASSVRASAPAGKSRAIGTGGIAAAVFVVALLAAAIVLPDALDDDPDSP